MGYKVASDYAPNTTGRSVPRWYARLSAIILAAMLVIALGVAWRAVAATTGPARYARRVGPKGSPARIVLRCSGYAEDSLAHLRMVAYDGRRVVYACRTKGY